jgi:hypothetical protein
MRDKNRIMSFPFDGFAPEGLIRSPRTVLATAERDEVTLYSPPELKRHASLYDLKPSEKRAASGTLARPSAKGTFTDP